jgi:hypothetical protein
VSLEKMLDEVKDMSELRVFSEAQQKTIIKLSKKNKELEEEVVHLKKLLESQTPIIQSSEQPIGLGEKFLTSDQESICRMELNKLKQTSFERELTLEEAKRVDIYSKILNVLENSPKTIKVETKGIPSQDLMSLVQSEEIANEQ